MARTPPKRRPRPAPGRTAPRARPGVPEEKLANKVAVATTPALARLMGLPRLVPPIAALLLLFAGLIVGGMIGLVLLLALAGVLGWFLAAFWPVTPTPGRVLRVSVVLGLVLVAILNAR